MPRCVRKHAAEPKCRLEGEAAAAALQAVAKTSTKRLAIGISSSVMTSVTVLEQKRVDSSEDLES